MSVASDKRVVGMAIWLLQAPTLVDRVEWVVRQGMGGVALLQDSIEYDPVERADAAAAIREAGLVVTYHGNVHHKLLDDGQLDESFVGRVIDDVLWWHENAGGVRSCCSDPIHETPADGQRRFAAKKNERLVRLMGERLCPAGIAVGLENGFGGPQCYQSPDDIARFARQCAGVPRLATLLDVGHVNVHLGGRGGIGQYVRQLPLPIAEVHVTDNLGQKDEHRHLGYGTLDVEDLCAGLRAIGYTGPLTIEVCVDILNGRYGSDISDDQQTRPLLVTRDKLQAVWR